jgi:hypothetical protein
MKKICIIGAGAAGCILADRLLEYSNSNITLLDIDDCDKKYSQLEENSLDLNTQGASFGIPHVRAFGFGGSTNLWHGLLTKLDENDINNIDYRNNGKLLHELEISYSNLEGLIPGANLINKVSHKKTNIDDLLSSVLSKKGSYLSKFFILQKRPFRTRELIKGLDEHERLTLIRNAIGIEIYSDINGNIQSLKYYDHKFMSTKVVYADIFVISTGGLETPRILLQSIKSNSLKIDNKNIGKNLIDHPWSVLGAITSSQIIPFNRTDSNIGYSFRKRIGVLVDVIIDETSTVTNNCLVMKPFISENYLSFVEILKNLVSLQNPYKGLINLLNKFNFKELFEFSRYIAYEKFGIKFKAKNGLIFAYIEQLPCPKNYVTISEKSDDYGRIIPIVKWCPTSNDFIVFNKLQNLLCSAFTKSSYNFKPNSILNTSIYSGCHFAGTARIGESRKSSVVDIDLKVHDTNNLYVCDLSIFPNFGNSNPTYTLFAFADRLAIKLARI